MWKISFIMDLVFQTTYSPSDDEHIPFTRSFSFRTGLSDNDSNGRFKNEYSRKEEMTYYAEILMSQL